MIDRPMVSAPLARFADRPEDFAKLGIQPGHILPFEDGMRTQGGPGG